MANSILLYPSLNDELLSKIRFQGRGFEFFYTDKDDEEHPLELESAEAMSSTKFIKDDSGVWTQDDNNLCFRRQCRLSTVSCLFGENGIVCEDARIGVAIQWTSSDSKQRGVVKVTDFGINNQIIEMCAEKDFGKAQLRGEVSLKTILYVAAAGNPNENEIHLANTEGYVLGEIDSLTIRLDGTNSSFPIYEVSEPGQPLWYIKCEWDDPTIDSLEDCVSINLNTAHKKYMYIDRNQKVFDSQLLVEIMASAITLLIEKVRTGGYWEQILQNDSLEQGSVGQVIYYFYETLEWDLSSAETVSLSARKFFDQRL